MQSYINPALQFSTQLSFISGMAEIPYQANNNALKTLSGISNIVDNLQITLFPEIVDLLVTSRSFVGLLIEGKIDKAYKGNPQITINNDALDSNAIKTVQSRIDILLRSKSVV